LFWSVRGWRRHGPGGYRGPVRLLPVYICSCCRIALSDGRNDVFVAPPCSLRKGGACISGHEKNDAFQLVFGLFLKMGEASFPDVWTAVRIVLGYRNTFPEMVAAGWSRVEGIDFMAKIN
jgi:hypothetical protein